MKQEKLKKNQRVEKEILFENFSFFFFFVWEERNVIVKIDPEKTSFLCWSFDVNHQIRRVFFFFNTNKTPALVYIR